MSGAPAGRQPLISPLIIFHQREPLHMMKEANNAKYYYRRFPVLRLLFAMD